MNKKLIEVAIPLDVINAESAREKSIRHGHPSTLHLWWARRPLATARAVLFASLVDDPSSHPELFPTEDEQNTERQRLFGIITRMVKWENTTDVGLFNEANAEIKKYVDGDSIEFLDPFSGGGAIPLEAQRLGLKTHAHDLNPVSIIINRAMIDIPYRFANTPPINPKSRSSKMIDTYNGTDGLGEDINYYGKMLRELTFQQIGGHYPTIDASSSGTNKEANVIAWIWARTIECPNPACKCKVPLVKSFDLSKKQNCHINPTVEGTSINYFVEYGNDSKPGTINSKGATCLKCGSSISFRQIRDAASSGNMHSDMMAIVVEGDNKRIYLNANEAHVNASVIDHPTDAPDVMIGDSVPYLQTPKYGMTHYSDMFTNRQLDMIMTFIKNARSIRGVIEQDALSSGITEGEKLCDGGSGAKAYSEAISVYLSFIISKLVDYHSTICSWHNSGEKMRNTFGRQAIPMVWDYAEGNPFCSSTGCFDNMLNWIVKCIPTFPANSQGVVKQINAMDDCLLRDVVVSTDPPYYDNIGYADLSDYFYIWLRCGLKDVYPDIFSTMMVPKVDELVAMKHKFNGNAGAAKCFFEDGMLRTFLQINKYARFDVPVTIYYAFKQSETEDDGNLMQRSSSGWETMLSAIIKAGFIITGTWPVRTELSNRMRGIDSNALASSIVLVCRKIEKRSDTTRREFITELRKEMRFSLSRLQKSNIAPVDLAQSSIGPGISVYSKYEHIMESDGSFMTVRSALQIINQELDAYIAEQEGDLDSASRFCVDLYTQYAFNDVKYGEAEVLARAKNTSIDSLSDRGLLYSEKGIVRLLARDEQPSISKVTCTWSLCQQLTYLLETSGIDECAKLLVQYPGSLPEDAKALAYRLYSIAERKKWTQEAYAYNNLIVAWPDIQVRLMKLIDPASGKHSVGLDRWS
jgi:putative DNA methylase